MPAHGNDCDFVSLAPEGIALLRNFAEHMGDPSVHAVEKKRQAAQERKQGKNSHVRLPPAFRLAEHKNNLLPQCRLLVAKGYFYGITASRTGKQLPT